MRQCDFLLIFLGFACLPERSCRDRVTVYINIYIYISIPKPSPPPPPPPSLPPYLPWFLKECSLFLIDLLSGCFTGKWKGYFVDNRYSAGGPANNKWYMDINMAFENNHQFTATGSDEVGDFNFEDGKITGR